VQRAPRRPLYVNAWRGGGKADGVEIAVDLCNFLFRTRNGGLG
jgi:hypothetical protein